MGLGPSLIGGAHGGGGNGNATVPGSAPIQPPQAFVDNIQSFGSPAGIDIGGRAITHLDPGMVEGWMNTLTAQSVAVELDASNNAIPVADIDGILTAAVNSALPGGVMDLTGGTNAPPTPNGIGDVTIHDGGAGYSSGQALVFTGGGGSGAVGTIDSDAGVITAIFITNPGNGYTSNPVVTVAGGGSGAVLTSVRMNRDAWTLINTEEWNLTTN